MDAANPDKSGFLSLEPGLAALLGIVVLAYLNSFSGAFQFDDYPAIVQNAGVHSFPAWLHDLGSGIRPLLKLSYLINWLSGTGRAGFHAVNLLIHLGNTLLLYRLARKYAGTAAPALVAAGIFALHPLQTEAVTYICGRSASLAAFFYLAGVLAHAETIDTPGRGGRWLVPLLFVCALLVKETAVTLPAALLLWDLTRGTKLREHLRSTWPCWLLLLVALIVLAVHARYAALLHYSFAIRPWGENLLLQAQSIAYLISRLVVLNGMNIDPDLAVALVPLPVLAAGTIGVAALAALGWIALRSRPWLAFGILWYLLHLLPTNSFIPRLDLVNDRQAYLPLAGAAITAGIAVQAGLQRCGARVGTGAATLFMVILAMFTSLRNRDYRSEINLWEDTAGKSPRKARVHNNLGYAYFLAGRHAPAREEFLAALRLDPNHRFARNNLMDNEAALIGRLHLLAGAAMAPLPPERGSVSPATTGRSR
jgi:tetratricopeptide (TPR) repeat protein